MVTTILFGLAGGLGLFLFGIHIMAEGLQKLAGNKMRRVLEILTGIPIIGVAVGAIVTALVQSSSATTVMVVGFVNAGLMTLKQAISVIMGANIGTTITAQLIAFRLTDYALPAIGIGFALQFFGGRRLTKYLGQGLLGFGLIFLGMGTMASIVKPLSESPYFINILISFGEYPLLGILAAAVFTGIIQSSAATAGLTIVMMQQNLISLTGAIAIIFGSNIGTTVTALLACIGTSLGARRTAVAHLLFNVIGVIIFTPFLRYFANLVQITSINPARQVANAHTIFNVVNTMVFIPFISTYAAVVTKIMPGEQPVFERGLKYIDQKTIMLTPPSIALSQTTNEILRMAQIAEESYKAVFDSFMSSDTHSLDIVLQKEDVIDELEKEITFYLAKLAQRSLTESESRRVTSFLHSINDIERIGDHIENISYLVRSKIEERLPFSNVAVEELRIMFDLVLDNFHKAYTALEQSDQDLAREVLKHENEIDLMERTYRNNHIQRLNEGICYPASGIVYLDIISNLERIGDHSSNIANIVMGDWR